MTGDAVAVAIAHEVKQPLTGMITSADAAFRYLDRPAPDLDAAKSSLRRITAVGHRAAAVIESVRAAFKQGDRSRTRLDVNELVRRAISLARGDLLRQEVRVEVDLSSRLPQIDGDPIQLQQVLLNLISNAMDAMVEIDSPRILNVRTESFPDEGVAISIADNGPGVERQDVDRIFSPQFTTKPDGMGLGLAICRSIVEAHAGRLTVAPNPPRGAIFQVILRAADPPASQA